MKPDEYFYTWPGGISGWHFNAAASRPEDRKTLAVQ